MDLISNFEEIVPLIFTYYISGSIFFNVISVATTKHSENELVNRLLIGWIFWQSSKMLTQILKFGSQDAIFILAISILFSFLSSIIIVKIFRMNFSNLSLVSDKLGFSKNSVLSQIWQKSEQSEVIISFKEPLNGELCKVTGKIYTIDNGNSPSFISLTDYDFNTPTMVKMSDSSDKYLVLQMSSILFIEFDVQQKKDNDANVADPLNNREVSNSKNELIV